MAEFKISTTFLSEVNTFANAGKALNDGYSSIQKGSLALSTVNQYIEQHRQIKELMDAYISLLKKDEDDLKKMQETAQSVDEELAAKYNV